MIDRRSVIMSAGCLAALGGGAKLKPRRNVVLLKDGVKLADLVPPTFGAWRSEAVGDPLAINGPDSLANRLYNQELVRIYTHNQTGDTILMLLAYGQKQTDDLQLHRPEVCYPAFGFAISRNEPLDLSLGGARVIPARQLFATQADRFESVIYWSRLGEYLPRTGEQQRGDRFRIGLQGVIPDGVLARFSLNSIERRPQWDKVEAFIPQLMAATTPAGRTVLIGADRAKSMSPWPAVTNA